MALDHMKAAHHDAGGATHALRQKAHSWSRPVAARIESQSEVSIHTRRMCTDSIKCRVELP